MDVLFKWCRKRYGLEPVPPEAKKPKMDGAAGENGNGAAAAEGEEGKEANGEPEEPEISFVKPQKPFVK